MKPIKLICLAMSLLLLCSCVKEPRGAGDHASPFEGKKFAIVVKSAGNPYNEKEIEGFREVIEQNSGTVLEYTPESPTAEAQIALINELVAQNVDCIAVAGNSEDALQTVLRNAMNAGIKVLSFDSAVNSESRMVHINQVSDTVVGETLIKAAYEILDGSGQFAILSTTNQANNQNIWISAMRSELESGRYDGITLVDIVYGNDNFEDSLEKTEELLTAYENLELIIAPTVVGLKAAAVGVNALGAQDRVKVTGLGLPSEMYDYVGDERVCPYLYLWNPVDVGRLAAWAALSLVDGSFTGTEGERLTAGDMGEYTVARDPYGGTEIILRSDLLRFDPSNIEVMKEQF